MGRVILVLVVGVILNEWIVFVVLGVLRGFGVLQRIESLNGGESGI